MKIGDRVLIPRTSGEKTTGIVIDTWGYLCRVKLDQKGRRGQDLGKVIPTNELEKI